MIDIGKVQRTIFTSKAETLPFQKASSQLSKGFPEPDGPEPTPIISEHIAKGEFLSSVIIADLIDEPFKIVEFQ